MRIVFVSDTHLSVCRNRPWPDARQRGELLRFLTRLTMRRARGARVDQVILLGDIFDTWRFPPEVEPPGYEELCERHGDILAPLRLLSEEGRLVYVIGNHDHDMPSELISRWLPGVRVIGPGSGPSDAFWDRDSRLYAVHGHQYSLFNNVSRPGWLLEGFPIGYYITRLRAGLGDGSGFFSFGQLHEYLHEVKGVMDSRRGLFAALVTSLKGCSRCIHLPGRRKVSCAEVVAFAKGLSRRCSNLKASMGVALEATLTVGANRACLLKGAQLVVLGHTHRALLDEFARFPPWHRRTYANAGCWCRGVQHYVVADTKKGSLELVALNVSDGAVV